MHQDCSSSPNPSLDLISKQMSWPCQSGRCASFPWVVSSPSGSWGSSCQKARENPARRQPADMAGKGSWPWWYLWFAGKTLVLIYPSKLLLLAGYSIWNSVKAGWNMPGVTRRLLGCTWCCIILATAPSACLEVADLAIFVIWGQFVLDSNGSQFLPALLVPWFDQREEEETGWKKLR